MLMLIKFLWLCSSVDALIWSIILKGSGRNYRYGDVTVPVYHWLLSKFET